MIDLARLEKYRENNRIEAKRALGGLPHSIWETYSSFANTLGGVILLGVEEREDKTLHPVDLPDPEGLASEFWALVNDHRKASVNILSPRDVVVEEAEGARIVVINVPRADRVYRPVFVDGSPLNTYRRSGEGDYRCTGEEYQAMVRDASVRTQDMKILTDMNEDAIVPASLSAYRRAVRMARPDHIWNKQKNRDFLTSIGALATGDDGLPHPTAAGLLAFGRAADIRRQFRDYSLQYEDGFNSFDSASGGWTGNVFDFYFRVCSAMGLEDGTFHRKPEVIWAIREALANCLVNADYYGRSGVRVHRSASEVTISNPGCFRIEVAEARSGGTADPRNSALLRMFNLIDVGDYSGSGIPAIYDVWNRQDWAEPSYRQHLNPDRVELFLPLVRRSHPESDSDRKPLKSVAQKDMIISYLTDNVTASRADISALLGLKRSRTRTLLRELIDADIVVPEGDNRERRYRLKA